MSSAVPIGVTPFVAFRPEADASEVAIRLEAGPSFWAKALIMVALSLPLPAEAIKWADIFLPTPFLLAVFLVNSELLTQRALVTP